MPEVPTHLLTITQEMRDYAKAHPNSRLDILDPAFTPGDQVPGWGIIGSFGIDANGDIDETFRVNQAYRPSPTARGMVVPETKLEKALQDTRTGYATETDLINAVLDATVLVYAKNESDTTVSGFRDNNSGTVLITACTSRRYVPDEWPAARAISGRELVAQLGGCPLLLNPNNKPSALIPAAHLIAAASR